MNTLDTLQKKLGNGRIACDKPLAPLTTLKVGGCADFLYEANIRQELVAAVSAAIELHIPFFVLGGGSNVVLPDQGLRGLTILNRMRQIQIVKFSGSVHKGKQVIDCVLVRAESGVVINQLVRYCIEECLAGLEYHLGLPGTVGGALFMNSKWTKPISYIGDSLYEAEIIKQDGSIVTVPTSYFNFGYDQSILQKTHETVVSATFKLQKISDKDILWKRAHEALAYRNATQPIGKFSAGCTFRNIAQSDALRLATPNHTTSAGFLVDQVNLKGFVHGGASFSDKHANFITNDGTAHADDVIALIKEAQRRVQERFSVMIEPEIVIVEETYGNT